MRKFIIMVRITDSCIVLAGIHWHWIFQSFRSCYSGIHSWKIADICTCCFCCFTYGFCHWIWRCFPWSLGLSCSFGCFTQSSPPHWQLNWAALAFLTLPRNTHSTASWSSAFCGYPSRLSSTLFLWGILSPFASYLCSASSSWWFNRPLLSRDCS